MIPVNEPLLAKNTLKYVSECVETGWISSAGSYIKRFEQEYAEFCGVKHAITTTSGTTALHLALATCGIRLGDAVLIPSLTMIAVPYSVLYTGAIPIPIDVDREIFNIDPEKIRIYLKNHCRYKRKNKAFIDMKTGKKIRAILPVHLYGHPCHMKEIKDIADEYNLLIIEDAAEAHGALYYPENHRKNPLLAGAIGDVGCFSFYANKIITTGEGGMIVTNSDAIASKARHLKNLAHSSEKRFLHTELAFNYRMTNLQAAVGTAQLEELTRFISIKQKMAESYNLLLKDIQGLTLPVEKPWARNVYWMYAVVVEDELGISRDNLMITLKNRGVDTRSFFVPVHKQPVFTDNFQSLSLPISEELSQKGFYLPSGLALREEQIKTVSNILHSILRGQE
ncbi:MAG: aminotransferase class I/II-fold pyridoxal phosphate-dependent enzyme [Candidatus Aminicenantes bacterium]|nr:aminotransferase class I/II-fold pyridoxal phosphate-dependent enzyme [Candidatus Aminicenantes bacterium]